MSYSPGSSTYIFWSFLFICLLIHSVESFGQEGVSPQILPDAPVIILDTVFQTPDKPMPFDRHFTLKFSMPGKVSVRGFYITPIDKLGERKVTRRDYRSYIWAHSRNSDSSKKVLKNNFSWERFRMPKTNAAQILSKFKTYSVGKRTGIEVKIPPLDPKRNYQVTVIINDPEVSGKLSALILPLTKSLEGSSSLNIPVFEKLEKQYNDLYSNKMAFRGLRFPQYLLTYKSFEYLKPDMEFHEKNYKKFDLDKYEIKPQYRFVFSQRDASQQIITGLSKDRFLEYQPNRSFTKIPTAWLFGSSFLADIKDIEGNKVDYLGKSQPAKYKIYVSIRYVVENLKGHTIFNELVSFQKLGEVQFKDIKKDSVLSWTPISEETKDPIMEDLRSLNLVKGDPEVDTSLIGKEGLKVLLSKLLKCNCRNTAPVTILEENEITLIIATLNNPPKNYIVNCLTGKSTLKNPTEVEDKDVEKMITNIDSNLKSLGSLKSLTKKVLLTNLLPNEQNGVTELLAYLDSMERKLIISRIKLKNDLKILANFKESNIKNWQYTSNENVTTSSTHIIDFMTASKFKINPDFGFVAISNAPGNGLVTDVVPYLGFNINMRSIDKNIPMRAVLRKPLSYYLSFMGGVTLSSIKIDKKREDLWSKYSLMLGGGIRVNNYLKVIAGGVLYKKLSTNPLSDKKEIASSPFFGLSVDYDLSELFGGINKLFK